MKISSYYKSLGHETGFHIKDPDKVFVSCIFSQNLSQAQGVKTWYPDTETYLGGPGLGYPNPLPPEIDHMMPDYSLYPKMDYSLGYTTRGCPNACPFCIVPKLEGKFKEVAPLSEFCHPDFTNVVLWDNNFFYSKLWKDKLTYLKENGLKVCFNQGLDARLMDEEKSKWLKDTASYNLKFKSKTYYFSWDLMKNSDKILEGLQNVMDAGIRPATLMIFILCGFNTTHEEDLYRFRKLREIGCDPFVMKYNNKKDDPWLNHFARWVNKRVYKACSYEDYKGGVFLK